MILNRIAPVLLKKLKQNTNEHVYIFLVDRIRFKLRTEFENIQNRECYEGISCELIKSALDS